MNVLQVAVSLDTEHFEAQVQQAIDKALRTFSDALQDAIAASAKVTVEHGRV